MLLEEQNFLHIQEGFSRFPQLNFEVTLIFVFRAQGLCSSKVIPRDETTFDCREFLSGHAQPTYKHQALKRTPIWPVTDGLQLIVPTRKHHKGESTGLGFLGIPREIRDEIYAFLLCLNRYRVQQNLNHRHYLETAILRVNKQINSEALETLHGKNC